MTDEAEGRQEPARSRAGQGGQKEGRKAHTILIQDIFTKNNQSECEQ